MKKRMSKWLIALSTLGVSCLAIGAASLTSVNADTVADTVDTVSFEMEAGAAVRLATDGNGIRYHVTMPAAEHTALEANTAYSSVIYGILVAPADYEKTYGALNKANVFGIDENGASVETKYDWSAKNEDGELEYNGDGTKARIMNFRTGKLTEYTAENGAAMAGYYGSIVDLNADNILREFVGVGYIRYVDAATGKVDYVFAERNDNVRSMADIARSAIADEEVTATDKATLKTTYLENVYTSYWKFDTKGSKQIVKGAALSWDSVGENNSAVSALVKYDDFDADGSGNEDTTTIGRQDLVIDMGGVYKVKEIENIVITYRYLNTSSSSMHLYVNGIGAGTGDDLDVTQRLTGLTYKGDGANWYTPTATETFATLTIPQSSLKSNSLGASTILAMDDYLTMLTFAQPSWKSSATAMNYRAEIQIDSIQVNLVPVYHEEYLEFNSEEALEIVSGMGTQIVDLGNGNKAVQATFKNDSLNDPNTTMDDGVTGRVDFRINLGGLYKVSEIESVEFSYKITAIGSTNLWWRLILNDITDDTRRVTGAGIPVASVMDSFKTITVTNARLKQNTLNPAGNILSDDDYLTSISFANASWQQDLKFRCTIQIDYIRVNLKSAS